MAGTTSYCLGTLQQRGLLHSMQGMQWSNVAYNHSWEGIICNCTSGTHTINVVVHGLLYSPLGTHSCQLVGYHLYQTCWRQCGIQFVALKTSTDCTTPTPLWFYHTEIFLVKIQCTRAVRKVSVHFEYHENRSRGVDIIWQPVGGDLTAHMWTATLPWG